MKAGLAVFISVLLHASTALAQGVTPGTAGGAKPPAMINTPGGFQNTPGALQQFSRPAAPSALFVPTGRSNADADMVRAEELRRNAETLEAVTKQAKKQYEDKPLFQDALRTVIEVNERKRQRTNKSAAE